MRIPHFIMYKNIVSKNVINENVINKHMIVTTMHSLPALAMLEDFLVCEVSAVHTLGINMLSSIERVLSGDKDSYSYSGNIFTINAHSDYSIISNDLDEAEQDDSIVPTGTVINSLRAWIRQMNEKSVGDCIKKIKSSIGDNKLSHLGHSTAIVMHDDLMYNSVIQDFLKHADEVVKGKRTDLYI